jgi:hypothetical protein
MIQRKDGQCEILRWGCYPINGPIPVRIVAICEFIAQNDWVVTEPDTIVVPIAPLKNNKYPVCITYSATLIAAMRTLALVKYTPQEMPRIVNIKSNANLYVTGDYAPPRDGCRAMLESWSCTESLQDYEGTDCNLGMANAFNVAAIQLVQRKPWNKQLQAAPQEQQMEEEEEE